MKCPSCGRAVASGAWLCSACDHIIDPSVLGETPVVEEGSFSEPARTIAWEKDITAEESASPALILGDVGLERDPVSARPNADDRDVVQTATVPYWDARSQLMNPEARPRRTGLEIAHHSTPDERHVLSCIDGSRTVRQIRQLSGLDVNEVVVALLTLLDKRTIAITGMPPRPPTGSECCDPSIISSTSSAAPVPGAEEFDEDEDTAMIELEALEMGSADPGSGPRKTRSLAENSRATATPRDPAEWRGAPHEPRPPTLPEPLHRAPSSPPSSGELFEEDLGSLMVPRPVLRNARVPPQGPDNAGEAPVEEVEPEGLRILPRTAAQPPPREASVAPIDPLRASKARKLYEQALADEAAGNHGSARMNMKLALTFDPTHPTYAQAHKELERRPLEPTGPIRPRRTKARELYDAATDAEHEDNYDLAITLLEQAIAESKQAAFHNRLGVLLATKKHEFIRAQHLIEEAIDMSPGNPVYERNLRKVLSMAATYGLRKVKKPRKTGLLGIFGRRGE